MTMNNGNRCELTIQRRVTPPLDPGFVPAALWTRAYRQLVAASPQRRPVAIALTRPDGVCFRHDTEILPHTPSQAPLNLRYLERLIKLLLWQKGGSRVLISGADEMAAELAAIYSPNGARAFDVDLIGTKVFLEPLRIESAPREKLPDAAEPSVSLGRHLEGCRIGFDLGGSDRKSAAVIDGNVVFSEEIAWNPYFESDPQYHIAGVRDSLRRAAAHLPRVDAIGGSSAGVYVNNEVRVASLFRGVSAADFEAHVRRMFLDLRREWNGIPFEVVNDGEVTALAGSMSLNDTALLGVSLGTSQAGGYCDAHGHITTWLNELAFVPVDYRADAPADEWSGDRGCGVQYFSQQAVARLATVAGFAFAAAMPLAERLVEVQNAMKADDARARLIYETIGTYLGYTIAHYADHYDIRNLLILGRVTSGKGGDMIIAQANEVMKVEFPELADAIRLTTPNEKDKRHGQAIAAASLPARNRS